MIKILYNGFPFTMRSLPHTISTFSADFSRSIQDEQVIEIIKSVTAKQIFMECPEIKKELWGGEFWTDGYYIATISERGDKKVIDC